MNLVILSGRLTRDPETRYTNSNTPVCSFSLAVADGKTKGGDQKTQFIPCVAWGKTAELIDQYFTKGKPLTVTGRITVRTYDKNGEKRYITEVVCNGIEFPLTVREEVTTATAFEDLEEDIDLPF